ncbi:MAG: hypothetical protein IKY16_07950 [Bacteroidales bacterium]|nr:hypothetical protein [Acidaminococcaceae bacterium]MBR5014521.1 hypothetical protein [Bacteroidales bacterium]
MEKTVKIGDKEVKFKTSAAVTYLYRQKFGRDLIVDMTKLESRLVKNEDGSSSLPIESLEMFEELAYMFAKHADPENIPDDIVAWLDQFETFDIYLVFPEIISLWTEENKSFSTLKKKGGKLTVK